MADLENFEAELQYSFNDTSLLEEAFIAAGAARSNNDIAGPAAGNKRLALIGDAVLRLSVLDEWFPTDSSTALGHEKVQQNATNKKLMEIAKEWQLTRWLKENPCQAGEEPQTTLASMVEAIIGGVWIDCGKNLTVVKKVIERLKGGTSIL